jgi:hypothetical protein
MDVPAKLLREAKVLLGSRSASETVAFALKELIRHGRIEELKALHGLIDLEIDRRPRRRAR